MANNFKHPKLKTKIQQILLQMNRKSKMMRSKTETRAKILIMEQT